MRSTLAVLACLTLPAALAAQSSGHPISDSLLADVHFAAGSQDSLVVPLHKRAVYRIEILGGAAVPSVAAPGKHSGPTFVEPIEVPPASVADAAFHVYPMAEGSYVIRPGDADRAHAVTIRVYGDAEESRARVERIDAKHVRLGFEVDAGLHNGYLIGGDPAGLSTGGHSFEGCLLISSGGALTGCLGAEAETRGDGVNMTWFFIEPRVRLLRSPVADLGLSLRFGQGNASQLTVDPSGFAPGAFAQHFFSLSARGTGAAVRLAYAHRFLSNTARFPDGPGADRVSVGLLWIP